MLAAVHKLADCGYTIKGGNFDTLDDFVRYYECHGRAAARFIFDDLEALFGIVVPASSHTEAPDADDPREVAAYLDSLTA